MKVLITENKIDNLIKNKGIEGSIKLLGGFNNFCGVLNIDNPLDFLKSLPKMEKSEWETRPGWDRYYYEKGNHLFSYDRKYKSVWVNFDEVWQFLRFNFGLDSDDTKKIVKEWLSDVYNLETREIQSFYAENRKK